MKNEQKKQQDDLKDMNETYNPAARDFQRTEEDIDNISKSEKDYLNERTKKANTKPTKNKIN
jgi:hypothetical protein